MITRRNLPLIALLLVLASAALAAGTMTNMTENPSMPTMAPPQALAGSARYNVSDLVSDNFVRSDNSDAQLVNPWGIVFNPNGAVWIADNGTGVATLYEGDGAKQGLVVTIPPPQGGTSPSAPDGIAFNSSNDFVVSEGEDSGPAVFIFATEDGTISGWSPKANPTNAILAVDNSSKGTVYKGIAIAANGNGHFLYATDFHNAKIDVFDASFTPTTPSGSFSDPRIPSGFAPFGIANIGGDLYVTYAKQNDAKHDDVAGVGLGFVDEYDANGNLLRRFATRGPLNSPWGIAMAPGGFGRFSNTVLIGNFGDGRIHSYDLETGTLLGALRGADGHRLVIDGLWGLAFGNGVDGQPTGSLFVTSGPDGESHGIFARIDPASE